VKKRFIIKVIGRVQGVFYRASTAERASSLGLSGFVRNEPDGSVYIEAEGDEEILKQLVEWCKKGPPSARVEKCIVEEMTLRNDHSFQVKRH
jgi:acylphosphatase